MKKNIIDRFKDIYQENHFDYSKVIYTKMKDKVVITCNKHNHTFEQTPENHLKKNGCKFCVKEKINEKRNKKLEYYIEKFKTIHQGKYKYLDDRDKKAATYSLINILCEKHGEFTQTVSNHLSGKGCNKCAIKTRTESIKRSIGQVLKEFKKQHGNKYGYEKFTDYKNAHQNIEIYCKKHKNYFTQSVNSHIRGNGCPECGIEKSNEAKKVDLNHYKIKCGEKHNNFYNYEKSEYTDSKTNVKIECPKHGNFNQSFNNHLKGEGCPKCRSNKSKAEKEIVNFLDKYVYIEQSNKSILNGMELDIFIPNLNIAIEYNGLYWHSDNFKDKNYHLNKLKNCLDKDIRLINIFEDEWYYKKDIVKSRLLNILKISPNKIYARQCEIKEVTSKESSLFLDENHIQGKLGAKIRLGLYHKDKLVSLMTFGELRKNLGSSKKKNTYELLRFCNTLNTNIVGGASKLLSHFYKNYECEELISYADLRWSDGNLYYKLGFSKIHESSPNYYYIKGNKRENRFKYRKSELVKKLGEKFKTITEKDIMKSLGFSRIYDCGTIKFKKV